MFSRTIRVSPSFILLLVLLGYFAWEFTQNRSLQYRQLLTPPSYEDGGPPAKVQTPRIALMTFVTDERSYGQLALKVKDHYARRHGYDFLVDFEAHTDRAIVFWKFNMAERYIKSGKYDWIWWLDFDTLITNTEMSLTDIIDEELKKIEKPDEVDFLLTHDCNGFNAGSMIIRGHQRSLKFIHDSWAIHDQAREEGTDMSEQDSTVQLMADDEVAASRVHVVPQWKLNAFPQEIACFDEESKAWEPGQFVIHFAGAWAHVKGKDPTGQLMRKYEPHIRWGEWEKFYG